MAVEVYMDEIDTDAIGGFDRVAKGSYHGEVAFVDEDGGQKGEMVVDIEILRGTTANQEGKVHREFFSKDLNKVARKKMLALAIAGGLVTKQELDQHKANGTAPSLDFTKLLKRQICFNLEESEYNGKTYIRVAWDEIFHPTDKRASHIPLHQAMLAKAGITLPPGRNPDGAVSTMPKASAPAGAKSGAGSAGAPPAVSQAQAANVADLLNGVK